LAPVSPVKAASGSSPVRSRKIATSSDGATWTAADTTNSGFGTTSTSYINGVAYGNGKFVAVGLFGKIAYCAD
jgi:hypothetical protein